MITTAINEEFPQLETERLVLREVTLDDTETLFRFWSDIEALVMLEASRSVNVLLKLGFQEEGILREHGYWKGQFWDEYCFSLLKKDWIKAKG